jgi:hypothetical protein
MVAALGLGVPAAARAQVGGLVGFNSTNVNIRDTCSGCDDLPASNFSGARRSGFVGGVTFNAPVNGMFSVEVDAIYAQKGTRIAFEAPPGVLIKTNYLDIPVLGRLNMLGPGPTRVHLLVGPSLNLKVSENWVEDEEVMKRFQTVLVFGGGVTVKRFRVDVRYGLGLSDILKDPHGVGIAKNRVFSVLAGFGSS